MGINNVSWNNREAPTPLVCSSDSNSFVKNLSLSNITAYILVIKKIKFYMYEYIFRVTKMSLYLVNDN
jgi:hypothetical protein